MSSKALDTKIAGMDMKLDKLSALVEKESKYILKFHVSAWLVILVIFVLALSFDFFSKAIHGFIQEYLPGEFASEWWFFGLLGIGILLLLFFIIEAFHIPVTALEKLP